MHVPQTTARSNHTVKTASVDDTFTRNDGGVGVRFTCGTVGHASDATAFRNCGQLGCKGVTYKSMHPYAVRWHCTRCGMSTVDAVVDPDELPVIPALCDDTWIQHAVLLTDGTDNGLVVVCFGKQRVLLLPLSLALAIRDKCVEFGMRSETAVAYAVIHWCAQQFPTSSGQPFGSVEHSRADLPAHVMSKHGSASGKWEIGYSTNKSRIDTTSTIIPAVFPSHPSEAPGSMLVSDTTTSSGAGDIDDTSYHVSDVGRAGCDESSSQFVGVRCVTTQAGGTPLTRVDSVDHTFQWTGSCCNERDATFVSLVTPAVKESLAVTTLDVESSKQQTTVGIPWRSSVRVIPGLRVEKRQVNSERCRGSKRTRTVTPSLALLVNDVRCRCQLLLAVSAADMITASGNVAVRRHSPFSTTPHFATPLWDATACSSQLEQADGGEFSPYTPAFSNASVVDSVAFPLRPDVMEHRLRHHPHRAWLANGSRWGFSLMSDGAVRKQELFSPHFTPAETIQVEKWFQKQHSEGKVTTVVATECERMEALFISPTSVAPKSGGAPGEIRVCHNMSAGGQRSVNAGICFEPLEPIGLVTLDCVVTRIRHLRQQRPGVRILAAKCDLHQFFRLIPLRKRDMCRVAQRRGSDISLHHSFSFGGRSAPHGCAVVTNAISDLMAQRGYFCPCFIDDFIIIDYDDRIDSAVLALRQYITDFGLTENADKFVAPTTRLAIVGVWFDLETMVVGVTAEKSAALACLLRQVADTDAVTVELLRKLGGKLSFLCPITPFGRCYTAPFWRMAGDANSPGHHHRRVTLPLRRAAHWWMEALLGTRFHVTDMLLGISPESPLTVTSAVTSDASDWGFGGVSETHKLFVVGRWTQQEVEAWRINIRECAGILMVVAALAARFTGTVVVFESDNECAVWAVNKGYSRHPMLRIIVAALYAVQELFRFLVVCKHIPGVKNVISDKLSRGQLPAASLPQEGRGWSELPIPLSVRQLPGPGPYKSQQVHGLAATVGELLDLESRISSDSVVHDMKPLSQLVSHHRIPWLPYRDTVVDSTLEQ